MFPVDLIEAVSQATERRPLGDNDGKSGATLERAVLPDGQPVVIKRYAPDGDLVMRSTHDLRGREVEMWQAGVFELLPPEVEHAILGGWFDEDDHGVLVMRDLGDAPLRWETRLDAGSCRRVLRSIVALHRTFQGRPPDGLALLEDTTALFEPRQMGQYADEPLVSLVLRGWECWPEVAPGEVGDRVFELAQDTRPLTKALASLEPTMVHGDLATVNMAFERPDRLTLIDWGMSFPAPGGVDVGRFLAGCAHVLDPGFDDVLAIYREQAGASYDPTGTALGLLNGLVWLGWNKALDIVEHPDEGVRERERQALSWWLARADEALELLS